MVGRENEDCGRDCRDGACLEQAATGADRLSVVTVDRRPRVRVHRGAASARVRSARERREKSEARASRACCSFACAARYSRKKKSCTRSTVVIVSFTGARLWRHSTPITSLVPSAASLQRS